MSNINNNKSTNIIYNELLNLYNNYVNKDTSNNNIEPFVLLPEHLNMFNIKYNTYDEDNILITFTAKELQKTIELFDLEPLKITKKQRINRKKILIYFLQKLNKSNKIKNETNLLFKNNKYMNDNIKSMLKIIKRTIKLYIKEIDDIEKSNILSYYYTSIILILICIIIYLYINKIF